MLPDQLREIGPSQNCLTRLYIGKLLSSCLASLFLVCGRVCVLPGCVVSTVRYLEVIGCV